jgi:hypothetical protein
MEKLKNFISNHFDFKFYPVLIPVVLVVLAIVPCVKFMPEAWGYENGILENLQMIILAVCFFLAIFAKSNKKFFYFIALLIILIAAREVNYGRTLFFPVPNEVNIYYSWKDIKYGWLVNPLVGTYVFITFLYLILSKAYVQMWNIIKKVKFPVWNLLFLFLGIAISGYADKATDSFVFEEISESVFYVALVGIIWLYGYDDNFKN